MNKSDIKKGLIFWKWDREKGGYDFKRLVDISNNENDIVYTLANLDDNYHLIRDDNEIVTESLSEKQYKDTYNEYNALRSQGLLSISTVSIGSTNSGKDINDVILLLFQDEENSSSVNTVFRDPSMIARQGILDISKDQSMSIVKTVGTSVTIKSCPEGYNLKDLIGCDKIIDTNIFNIYRTDPVDDILYLLSNKDGFDADSVFKDLYDHALLTEKRNGIIIDEKSNNGIINGYCKDLKTFFDNNSIIIDIRSCLGVSKIDIDLSGKDQLNDDDKLVLSLLYGGINIHRTFVRKYTFEIELDRIKMNHMLVFDKNDILYIIAYTEDKSQVLSGERSHISEENEKNLRKRLLEIVDSCDDKK